MSSGAGDYSQEEFLGDGGHVVNKHSFPCGVFNGWLVHDWMANWILWGLVGIHTLLMNKTSYFIARHSHALQTGSDTSGLLTQVKKYNRQLGIHICSQS